MITPRLISRPRPTSAAFVQADAALPADTTAASVSPDANWACARVEVGLRRRAPQTDVGDQVRAGGAGRHGGVVLGDRLEFGLRLLRRGREPVRVLERGLERVGEGQAGCGSAGGDVRPVGQDGLGLRQQPVRVVEPPGPHRIADRLGQLPVPGTGDDRRVAGTGRLASVEQGQVLGPRDPGPPQVVEGRRRVFVEQVEQAPPVGRTVDGLRAVAELPSAAAVAAGG